MKINGSEVVDTIGVETTDGHPWEVHITADNNVYLGEPDCDVMAWCGVAKKRSDAIKMAFNNKKGGVR